MRCRYTTRVDMLPGGFGSILMDRGDRISWTGDAHLAQKVLGRPRAPKNTKQTKTKHTPDGRVSPPAPSPKVQF